METKGLLFGSIDTSTMIAVDVLESDFATTKNQKKMVMAQPLTSGLGMVGGVSADPAPTTKPDLRVFPHPAPEYTGCCHQHHNEGLYNHHGLPPVQVGWQSFGYALRFSVRSRRLP
jgi:hypothetical protein